MARAKGKGARQGKTRRKKPTAGRKSVRDLEPTRGRAPGPKGGADFVITKSIDMSSPVLR